MGVVNDDAKSTEMEVSSVRDAKNEFFESLTTPPTTYHTPLKPAINTATPSAYSPDNVSIDTPPHELMRLLQNAEKQKEELERKRMIDSMGKRVQNLNISGNMASALIPSESAKLDATKTVETKEGMYERVSKALHEVTTTATYGYFTGVDDKSNARKVCGEDAVRIIPMIDSRAQSTKRQLLFLNQLWPMLASFQAVFV